MCASSIHKDGASGNIAGTYVPVIDDISISLKFIEQIKNVFLGNYLDEDTIYQIPNPPKNELK
jgi:hypothetical protein